jgi:predicted Zn-dependent protease
LSDAADAEDRTEKHPVTPGVPIPARELYGEILLDRGNAKEALAAFEATLKKEPNRLGAFTRTARAAAQLGDTSKARVYFGKVVEQAGSEGSNRIEVAYARKYLAGHVRPGQHRSPKVFLALGGSAGSGPSIAY